MACLRHAAARVLTAGNPPVGAMRTILAEQEALVDSTDETAAKTFIALDGRFHQTLVDSANSELLATTYTRLRARLSRIGLAAVFASPNRQRPVYAERQAIVDALESGDVALAHAKIDEHLDVTLQILLRRKRVGNLDEVLVLGVIRVTTEDQAGDGDGLGHTDVADQRHPTVVPAQQPGEDQRGDRATETPAMVCAREEPVDRR